jgi:hypothetical protein
MDEPKTLVDIGDAGEFLDIGAGNETALFTGYDNHGAGRAADQGLQHGVELAKHAARQHVGRTARLVDGQPDN